MRIVIKTPENQYTLTGVEAEKELNSTLDDIKNHLKNGTPLLNGIQIKRNGVI